ncbi:formimidoylglutamate deiminase [Nocardioides aestuarii]|uniref:Formimidoylglutamate deiminase n=1 Tax=Nocardioides aestuarii TaxID=252231 RepID=A0ABW4TLK2_9ACTN
MSTSYLLERAWVGGRVEADVLVEIADGRFTRVEPGATTDAAPLRGLTLPGLANAHSHAFHRSLRGRTQRERGTFWTWRDQMYAVAERLDPDSYFRLARAAYREMVAAGFTSVGEFHYVHHRPDGSPYETDAMREALTAAAGEAGIRLVLLDTCYLSSGFGAPLEGVQVRYSDGSAAAWAARAGDGPAAIHSVRAVPRDQLHAFRGRRTLHVHLSEQVAENEACLAAYGVTPTRLLHDEGLLGPATTVVHATHLADEDVELLGSTGTNVCITPTTERDLADGIGPARRLRDSGCRVSIGTDSHAVVDPFEELRGLEMDERLATQRRGHWTAGELLDAGTAHDVLGLDDVGRIEVGARGDLVTIDTTSPRTAGTGSDEHTAVFAATAADVRHVVVDGATVYGEGDDEQIGRELGEAIGALWT